MRPDPDVARFARPSHTHSCIDAVSKKKPFNPFYAAVVVAGIAFAMSACAYGVMTVRLLDPRMADEGGLVGLMEQFGLTILCSELGVMGVLTVAAIATDEFWTRRAGIASSAENE